MGAFEQVRLKTADPGDSEAYVLIRHLHLDTRSPFVGEPIGVIRERLQTLINRGQPVTYMRTMDSASVTSFSVPDPISDAELEAGANI